MAKVLITDYVHEDLISGLEDMGYVTNYQKDISLTEVREIVHNYEGIVINSKIKMTSEMMQRGPQLQWIARLGSGLDIIDLPFAKVKGIKVYSAPEGNRNAVAEHALGMLLALNNQLIVSDQEVKSNIWRREARRGVEIMGKTVGIIGFGHTGSAFATKLSGFGCKILAYDKYKLMLDPAYHYVEQVSSLGQILSRSDIISLHLPLSDETRYLVDDTFLSKCKEGVIIINTSRGKVVQIEDLVSYLENGKIAGTCLDVFPNEKVATFTDKDLDVFAALSRLKNVVLSPHVAGWTHESLWRISQVLLLKIRNDQS
jgi:D-3-phosphoglycerate dehydrogenase